jgi:hypothetical protein
MGGWRLPQSKWHNPYTVSKYGIEAITMFEVYIRGSPLLKDIEELRGKRLGCWCAPKPCHGNVLLRLLDEATGTVSTVPKTVMKVAVPRTVVSEVAVPAYKLILVGDAGVGKTVLKLGVPKPY